MANKIGIVLALDGEKEFTQGMKSAQQSAKLCEQQLKNLDAEYKGSANSLEALTKKQEQLVNKQKAYTRELESAKSGQKNAVEQYKQAGQRLDELQKELEQAKSAMKAMEAAGDNSSKSFKDQAKNVEQLERAVQKQSEEQAKASTNITKWDTAVAKAEGDVRKANAAVEQNAKYVDEASKSADGCAKSIDKMGDEAQQTAGQVEQVSVSLGDMVKAKAVDLAGDAVRELGQKAIEAAKYVIDVGSKFEASMSKVEALSGATGAELEAMSQKAQELGSSTKFSASEVADGFSYMALAGWDAQQSVAAIDGIVNLAAASEMDLASASDMVTDYLSAFGMEASRAGEMADMMAYAQANSNTTTTQLGDAFGNCAANMNAAGQDMKTTTSFLQAFANQGVKGSEAGTKLSAIMRDITAKMKDGAIQIGDTSVAVVDSEGNFRDLTDIMMDVEAATDGMGTAERSAALSATFTSRSVSGLNMILAEGVGNIASYEAQLESCDGTAATMAGTMQNNLQGAITNMNSAAEGLGIALYNQVSGPLTDAVRLATDLISAITDVITPQKTELEKFIEETQQMNEQAQQSLDNAKGAIEQGATEITKLDGLSGIIKDANEQFGVFASIDTSSAADNVKSTATSIDESLSGMEESIGTVKSALNMSDVDTSGASDDLKTTAEGIATSAEGIQTNASNTAGSLDDIGKADTSGAVDNMQTTAEGVGGQAEAIQGDAQATSESLAAVGDADMSAAVQTFQDLNTNIHQPLGEIKTDADDTKAKLEAIGQADLSADNLKAELGGIRDSASDAAQGMDEFTKYQVKTAIAELAQQIPALSDAWDDVTGTLKITEQEFDNLINTQKRAIMETSLAKAQSEAMAAVAEATLSQKMAQDALIAAYKEASEAAGYEITTIDQLKTALEYDIGTTVTDVHLGQVQMATDALREADATLKDAENTQAQVAQATAEIAEEWGLATDAATDAGNASQEAAEKTEEQVEAENAAAEAAYKAQKEIADAHKAAADEIVDAYNTAKEAAQDAFSINPFDEWGQNAEEGIAQMQAALDSQLEGMTNYADNLQTVSEHVGKEITPEFLKYIEDMGVGGAQVMQELADAFESGDTSAVDDLMQRYIQAMAKQDEISSALAMDAVAFKLGIKEFASTPEEWQGLDSAIEYVKQFGDGVTETTLEAFSKAEAQAQACGVAIPDGLKEGIESGKDAPEEAVQAATQQIQAAIQGRADGLLQAAKEAGIQIPPGIAEGIEEGGDACVQAYSSLIDMIASSASAGDAAASSQAAGEQISDGVSEGISSGQGAVEAAAQEVVDAASTQAIAAKGAMSNAGMDVASAFAKGIKFMQNAADSAGKGLADGASQNATQTASFDTAGQNDGVAFANGISAQNSSASYAGQSLAESGKSGASSVGGWDSIGANMADGVASGIRSKASSIAQEAAKMVRDAINAAKQEAAIASPSKKTRDQIGKQLGAGVAKGIQISTKEVTTSATHQMNQTLKKTQEWLSKNKKKLQKKGGDMSSYIASGWQTAAKKLSEKNFGIADYTVNSKGEHSAKAVETYYSEIFSAAQKYLGNVEAVYDVSAKQEKTYWTNVRKNLKKGTQAYYDATKQIKNANAKIKQEQKQAAEDAKEAAEQKVQAAEKANAKILTDAEKYVNATEMTTKAEIAYWEQTLKKLKQGSDEYETVMQRIKDLKKEIGTISVAEDLLSTFQTYFNMGEKAVMQYWNTVRKQYKEGTAERVKADKQYLDAYEAYYAKKKQLDDEAAQIEKDRAADVAELEKNRLERIADLQKRDRQKRLDEEKRLAKSIADVNKKLTNDIANAQQKAIDDRTKSLVNAFSLFEEFESKSVSGQQLLFNMQSQAAGYKDWAEEIQKLQNRGILSQDIISQLLEAGPQQSAAIHALNMLSDKELEAYQKAYDEKMLIATQQAAKDASLIAGTNEEIERLRKEASERIQELKDESAENIAAAAEETAEEIAEVNRDTQENINKRNADAATQAAELKAAQANERLLLDRDINADFLALAQNIKNIASDQTSQLVNALKDATGLKPGATTTGTTPVQTAAVTPTTTTTKTTTTTTAAATPAKTAAQLVAESEAKSRAVAEANRELVRQAELQEQALKNNIKSIIATGKSRSKTLTDADKASHVALWEHIVSKYGRTPTTAMYKALAQALGVKVSSTPTSTQKNNILKALKSHGMASGTRYLNDPFAWMDEQGIGSEMIIRRADNARLNTNVQRGDAIIPAVNTQNLWEWSKLVPQDLARVASEASMNAKVMGGGSVIQRDTNMMTGMMEDMFILMQRYMPYIASARTLSVDGRQLAAATEPYTSNIMAMNSRRMR